MTILEKGKVKFEDTYLTIKNYKEPLAEIPKKEGFGFWGTLLVTTDGESVQCHICGKLFSNLAGHITHGHQMKVADYKEKYKLARKTALVSESERMRLKEGMLEMLKNMTPAQKRKQIEGMKKFARERAFNKFTIRLETKNKRGTCPDQLLDKIKEVARKLGKTPTSKEFIRECGTQRYKHLIFKTFGSWNKAIEMIGLNQEPARNALGKRPKWSDEELIEYLIDFTATNKKLPTQSDFDRGLLPDYQTYIRRFGGISKAREKAGLVDLLEDYNVKPSLGRWAKK